MTRLLALCALLCSPVAVHAPSPAPHAPAIPSSQGVAPTAATQPSSAPASLDRRAFLELHESPYDALVLAAAEEHGLDAFALLALLYVESRLFPHVRHRHSGALGIAQLSPGGRHAIRRLTGRPFTRDDALEPARAIPAAALLLAHLRARCGERRMLGAFGSGRCVRLPSFERQVERRVRYYRGLSGLPWSSTGTASVAPR